MSLRTLSLSGLHEKGKKDCVWQRHGGRGYIIIENTLGPREGGESQSGTVLHSSLL